MKKIIFTLTALVLVAQGAQAYTYNNNCPSNEWGGSTSLNPTVPTANGSAAAYQNMVNASYYNNYYNEGYHRRPRPAQSPRKQRHHGSAANKKHHND